MKLSTIRNLFLIISVFGLLYSCKSEKTETMLSQIDKMMVTVDSSNEIFQTIDTVIVSAAKTNAEQQLEYLEKFYTDTNYQNARYVDVYNSNFKLMRKLLKGYDRVQSEIDFSKNQLTHLSNDIKNGFAADTSYESYLIGEMKAVQKIKASTKTLKNWETKTVNRYNGMVNPIDSIINTLQARGLR